MRRRRIMKRRISVITAAFLAAAALTACGGKTEETAAPTQAQTAAEESKETEAAESKEPAELKELVVGASPAPHAEILEAARPVLEEKGYSLKIVEYTDYVQPNLALDTGDLDANYFQHFPYLEQFNAERGTKLVSAGAVHYEPFGIYAGKTASLEELADGAKVAVPNDATNEARALLLLEAQGLIKLKEGVGLKATKMDIVENPKNLELFEFAPKVRTPAEYGRYMIQDSGHYEYDPNLEEFYDYERYGKLRMEKETGAFTEKGYVAYCGTLTLGELMAGGPAEQHQREQEFQMGGM